MQVRNNELKVYSRERDKLTNKLYTKCSYPFTRGEAVNYIATKKLCEKSKIKFDFRGSVFCDGRLQDMKVIRYFDKYIIYEV